MRILYDLIYGQTRNRMRNDSNYMRINLYYKKKTCKSKMKFRKKPGFILYYLMCMKMDREFYIAQYKGYKDIRLFIYDYDCKNQAI